MPARDDEQIDRDALADTIRLRDHEREPRRPRITHRDIETIKSVRLDCPVPTCRGPVYVPSDSNRDRFNCSFCEARLVTARHAGGEVGLIQLEPTEDTTDA